MPVDTKRVQGPEGTISYLAFAKDSPSRGLRSEPDGRKDEDLRHLFTKVGIISQAKGSAYLEQGNTKVMCAVYGPREFVKRHEFIPQGALYCHVKLAPFACRRRRQYQQDNEEREMSQILREALEPSVILHRFPKSQVDVMVEILENDGSILSAALMCSSLALADASIPLYDMVTAASVKCYGNRMLLDPCLDETERECENHGHVTMGVMAGLDQVCTIVQDGHMDLESITSATELLHKSCKRLLPVLRTCLTKDLKSRKQMEE